MVLPDAKTSASPDRSERQRGQVTPSRQRTCANMSAATDSNSNELFVSCTQYGVLVLFDSTVATQYCQQSPTEERLLSSNLVYSIDIV